MTHLNNTYKGKRLDADAGLAGGEIETSPEQALRLYVRCPVANPTPVLRASALASDLGVADIFIKDERSRISLGSFKALGAAHAIAKLAALRLEESDTDPSGALTGMTFVCASAGNHGLSVASGARAFGGTALIYLAETVSEDFATRLRDKGATVVRAGKTYEDSMAAAMAAAEEPGRTLLPDSSWLGCTDPARDVMEGFRSANLPLSGEFG